MSADIIDFPAPKSYGEPRETPTNILIMSDWHLWGERFECKCGNQYFQVTPDGVFCPQCGNYHSHDELHG